MKTPIRQKSVRQPRPLPPSQRPFVAVNGIHSAGTVESHATQNKVSQFEFDCAKAANKWPQNAEVTEEAFLAAIQAVNSASLR